MHSLRSHYLVMGDGKKLHLLRCGNGCAPSVLILPGRAEPAAKYQAVAQRMLQCGVQSVDILDWRGQGLSARFPRRGAKPGQQERGHIASFGRLVTDLAEVIGRYQTPPYLLAHSMGGALALRFMQTHPDMANHLIGATLFAPMIDIPTGRWPRWVARLLAKAAVWAGQGGGYPPGYGDWRDDSERFEGNSRTGCADQFQREMDLLRSTPALQTGGPTWGWIDQSFRLISALRGPWPPITLPIQVLVGTQDPYIPPRTHEAFFDRFSSMHLTWIPQGRHELLSETAQIQRHVWDHLDRVLEPVSQTTGSVVKEKTLGQT